MLEDITAISLVTQVWNQSLVFMKKLRSILQQVNQKEQKLCSTLLVRNLYKWLPKTDFKNNKKKGYCFQCLFPGTSHNKEKHHDGMCQRDFVCKYKLHDKCPIKKNVLVCPEHRNDAENQKLFQKFKDSFIMKQPINFPYSQEI